MPKLLQETEIKLQWTDIEGRVKRDPIHCGPRSPGVHLMSGIVKPVLVAAGVLSGVDKEQLDKDEMPLRMAIGMAWEAWAQGLWPGMLWQPGECKEDGVIGSPDGLTLNFDIPDVTFRDDDTPVNLLEEFKMTWCSRRTYGADVTQHKTWMWQAAGYCRMLMVRFVRFHVAWACGDYKQGPPSPAYFTYLVEFTQNEIDSFWENVVFRNLEGAPVEAGN